MINDLKMIGFWLAAYLLNVSYSVQSHAGGEDWSLTYNSGVATALLLPIALLLRKQVNKRPELVRMKPSKLLIALFLAPLLIGRSVVNSRLGFQGDYEIEKVGFGSVWTPFYILVVGFLAIQFWKLRESRRQLDA